MHIFTQNVQTRTPIVGLHIQSPGLAGEQGMPSLHWSRNLADFRQSRVWAFWLSVFRWARQQCTVSNPSPDPRNFQKSPRLVTPRSVGERRHS